MRESHILKGVAESIMCMVWFGLMSHFFFCGSEKTNIDRDVPDTLEALVYGSVVLVSGSYQVKTPLAIGSAQGLRCMLCFGTSVLLWMIVIMKEHLIRVAS